MANVIVQRNSPDDPGNRRPLAPIPNRDVTVSQQVGTLLAAANTFMAFLANTRDIIKEEPEVSPIDGGAKCAAETTLIGICNRLDKVMADESRWSMDLQNTLEAQLSQVYTEHTRNLVEQRHATALAVAPQSRLAPQLTRLSNGMWAAFIGNPSSEKDYVAGIGNSVQEALDNFDLVVQGKPVPFMEQWLKNYEQSNRQSVDGGTNPPVENVERNPQQTTNRREAGEKPKVRRAKAGQASRRRRDRKGR